MSRFNSKEVQESIIFDRLIDFLNKTEYYKERPKPHAIEAYATWKEKEFQDYPYYVELNKDTYGGLEKHIQSIQQKNERLAILDLACAFAFYLVEKYDLYNQLSNYSKFFFDRQKNRNLSKGIICKLEFLRTLKQIEYFETIRRSIRPPQIRNHNPDELPRFSTVGDKDRYETLNLHKNWIKQILDFDYQLYTKDGNCNKDIVVNIQYANSVRNRGEKDKTNSGLNVYHFYMLEFIDEVESLFSDSPDIKKDLESQNIMFFTNFFSEKDRNILQKGLNMNLIPDVAQPAVDQAIEDSKPQSIFGSYYAAPKIEIKSELPSQQVFSLSVKDFFQVDSEKIIFNFKEIVNQSQIPTEQVDWTELYIILKENDHWDMLKFRSYELLLDGQEYDNFFDEPLEIILSPTYSEDLRKKIFQNVQEDTKVGLATIFNNYSLFTVLAIDAS